MSKATQLVGIWDKTQTQFCLISEPIVGWAPQESDFNMEDAHRKFIVYCGVFSGSQAEGKTQIAMQPGIFFSICGRDH